MIHFLVQLCKNCLPESSKILRCEMTSRTVTLEKPQNRNSIIIIIIIIVFYH